MPTKEFKTLLDREFSKASVRPIVEIARPLLLELVNAGLMAFRRCEVEAAAREGENESIAALVLFRHVVEMADGVEVHVSNSCGTAAIPVLRSQFEASLGLSYLLASDDAYVSRSLSWLCCYLHDATEARETLEPGSDRGRAYLELYEKDFAKILDSPKDRTANAALAAEIDGLKNLLTAPQLAPIEAEYQRTAAKRRYPEWFSLFDGPRNRAELALGLKRGAEYRFLYGQFSSVAHGTDMSRYIMSVGGRAAFDAVRRPDELQRIASLSALLVVRAIIEMIHHFRPGENLETWYVRDVRPLLTRLTDLKITFAALPEE